MSVIAALDSGGDALSVALNINGDIVSRRSMEMPHSLHALPMLSQLLADSGVALDDCDAFAFAAGPGKFTALRLVCAVAKTCAYAKKKALIAVPSFAVLAADNAGGGITAIKCALPANRERVYFAVCRRRGGRWHAGAPAVIDAAADAPPAADIPDACGEGFRLYPRLLAGARLRRVSAYSDAAGVARAAAVMLAAGETTPPLQCEPLYARARVAQTMRERAAAKPPPR